MTRHSPGATAAALPTLLLLLVAVPAAACVQSGASPKGSSASSDGGPAGVSASDSEGQRFRVPEVDTLMDIGIDPLTGSPSMIVAEKLDFVFEEGKFNNAFREIPHEGFDEMRGAEVYDVNFTLIGRGFQYKADWCRGSYVVPWFFNETKAPANTSFFVFYEFINALVAPGPYQSGVDWWVIGQQWPHFVEDVSASVKIPGNVTGSPLFSYSPSNGTKVEYRDGFTYVHFRARNVSAGDGFRVTTYFPQLKPFQTPLYRWLRENWLAALLLFAILLSLPSILRTGIKEGRRLTSRASSVGPDPISPALVSSLLRPRAHALHFALAASELSRRGHLAIAKDAEQGSATIALAGEEPPGDMIKHERVVFEEGAERGSVREIAMHWAPVGRRFRGALADDATERNHFTRAPRAIGFLPLIITGIAVMVLGAVLMWALYRYAPFWGVAFCGMLLGVIAAGAATMVVGGLLGSYRSPAGDALAGAWRRKLAELRGRSDLEPQERLWLMSSAGSVRAAADIDETRARAADDPTPRMSWFSALE
jgi:hypothetical protein